jgi:hypothetical protein
MSGIFLSYSRADRDLAERIVKGLRGLGVDVWWDEDMPGVDWRDELQRQLTELSAVLVIWTPASCKSANVMAEARLGDRRDTLVNVISGVPSPPPPFDAINALPLDGWTGLEGHNGWSRLVRTVEDFLVLKGGTQRGEVTGALSARETLIRQRRHDVASAIDAYQATQEGEAAATTADAEASKACDAAQEQLRWVVERHATPTVVRAAQAEAEAALTAQDEARRLHRDAAATMAKASRAMTQAKRELEQMFEGLPSAAVHASAQAPQTTAQSATTAPRPEEGLHGRDETAGHLAAVESAAEPPGRADAVLASDTQSRVDAVEQPAGEVTRGEAPRIAVAATVPEPPGAATPAQQTHGTGTTNFWRGPITSESQAKSIIVWAAWPTIVVNLAGGLFVTAIEFSVPSVAVFLVQGAIFGVPALLLLRNNSHAAAITLLSLTSVLTLILALFALATAGATLLEAIPYAVYVVVLWRSVQATSYLKRRPPASKAVDGSAAAVSTEAA